MKTNLIFKRQTTVNGVPSVVTRVVSVDIPQINRGDGWVLSGHTDILETFDDVCVRDLTSKQQNNKELKSAELDFNKSAPKSFQSCIPGTAKLVRTKNVVKITMRRGKKTYNQTSPDAVCINDSIKSKFFQDCRSVFGDTGIYEFSYAKNPEKYNTWIKYMDAEYAVQRCEYMRKTE